LVLEPQGVLRFPRWPVLVRVHRWEYPRRAWVYRHRLLSGVLVSLHLLYLLYLLRLLRLLYRRPPCSSHHSSGLPS
jgi:hypothetical protein